MAKRSSRTSKALGASKRLPARRSKAAPPPPAELPPAQGLDLGEIRQRIDDVDRRLVEILNERSRLVVEVGRHKQDKGIPIYAPHREAQVLARVLKMNQGPLGPRAIEGIYREIMSGSFALERPISIGYLGPAGSFSHVAAVRHFGSSVAFEDLREVEGVFTEVQRGHVDYGLVPIENSIHGGITETLDAFARTAGTLRVYAEAQVEIHHALLANTEPSRIRKIYSKPEVFSQCRGWLATQYPHAELIPTLSSSRGVQMVAEMSEKDPQGEGAIAAAIGSTLAGELYDVNVLFEGIQDIANNITRFFVIARQEAQRSGDDKASIMFVAQNKPGALVDVLHEFKKARVNLTHIEKRPSRKENWAYTFFLDAEGHHQDAKVARAIEGARKHCKELHVLGSYPRSRRIL